MENPSGERTDGLEIISIGTLYEGPREKKYWSCSRGKDRYPYPVGYHAVQIYNGLTYRMEIHEGLKGPLFVITSMDGQSCTGQTADIAWEHFQKKGGPRVKMWHGKRYSCKIDGVELFGFRNPFVQRLLRDLVANVNGMPEQRLLSSSLCNDAAPLDHEIRIPDSCTYPDLLPYVTKKPHMTRKRSKKQKIRTVDTVIADSLERLEPQVCPEYAVATIPVEGNLSQHGDKKSMILSTPHANFQKFTNQEALSETFEEATALGGGKTFPGGSPLESSHCSDCVDNGVVYIQEQAKLFHGSLDAGMLENDSLMNKRVNDQGTTTEDSSPVSDLYTCAPGAEDLQKAGMVISEGSFHELCPEEGKATSTSNATSENSDFDSVGQEITNKMMSVLLPQALPLLKTSEKRTTICSSELPLAESDACVNLSKMKPQEENNRISNLKFESPAGIPVEDSPAQMEINVPVLGDVLVSDLPSCEDVKSVIPGSFNDDQRSYNASDHTLLCCDVPESDQAKFDTTEASLMCMTNTFHFPCKEVEARKVVTKTDKTPFIQISEATLPLRTETLLTTDIHQIGSSDDRPSGEVLSLYEARLGKQQHGFHMKKDIHKPEGIFFSKAHIVSPLQALDVHDSEGQGCLQDNCFTLKMEPYSLFDGSVEPVGCYMHPNPILSVLLSTRKLDIHICVLCGSLADKSRTLFVYKVPIKDPMGGFPSFSGYTTLMLPLLKDNIGRQVACDRSGLQFTPDGQCIVCVNSIRTPCCRERRIDCSCSLCASDCTEENAVKVIRVELGYVSVVAKFQTSDSVHHILVCEPSYLVAVEQRGRLHVWVMNPTWSAQIEEFDLPILDCMSPCIVELKGIPKISFLIVGHNGLGYFGLWDIQKRVLISTFSSPATSISQFVPVSLFCWESTSTCMEEHINGIMAATKISFSRAGEDNLVLPLKAEDVALWLLVSTAPNPNVEDEYQSTDFQTNPVGWRLALLVKNMVILGNALDPRASTVGASAGYGIIGTHDGLVYMWELSSGAIAANLHHFKGSVSCIAADSKSGLLAVAGNECQLLVCVHSPSASTS